MLLLYSSRARMPEQSRAWCFTLNNYTEDEVDALGELECKFMVYGRELGESKTPHLQGYVEFPTPRRFAAVKAALGGRCHLEPRVGKASDAANYCRKGRQSHEEWSAQKEHGPTFGQGADVTERGICTQPGQRTDLESLGRMVRSGIKPRAIAELCPGEYIKYGKGIEGLASKLQKDRTEPPTVIWRWGAAGVGKSFRPLQEHKSMYIKDGTMWWDGYEQQQAIMIDDFDGKWPFRDLLRLLDRYPYQGQYKGGYVKINSPFIYITCEYPPEHIYATSDNELAQITRRLSKVIEVRATEDRSLRAPERSVEVVSQIELTSVAELNEAIVAQEQENAVIVA